MSGWSITRLPYLPNIRQPGAIVLRAGQRQADIMRRVSRLAPLPWFALVWRIGPEGSRLEAERDFPTRRAAVRFAREALAGAVAA